MESTAQAQLQALREMATLLVEECTDEDLLDLICRLLAQPGSP